MQIRWAVIGAAGMVGTRATPEIMASHNCQLAAIADVCEDRIKALGEKWGVPSYPSAEEMLDQVACDAVYVASPQHMHREHVLAAASRGLHVLCEKPLGRNVREAEEMVQACERAAVKMGTGFNYRFHPLHLKARELVAEGVIGKVISARGQLGQDLPPTPGAWRQVAELSGGGSMVDTGCHVMDLIEFITGKPINRVMVAAANRVHRYEVEDVCAALLEFEDGGFALVDTYYCVPHGVLRNDLEINGSKGILYTIDTLRNMLTGGKLVVRTADADTEHTVEGPDMYRAQFEAFAQAILGYAAPPCSGSDGLHSQRLLDACYAAVRCGRKIEVATD